MAAHLSCNRQSELFAKAPIKARLRRGGWSWFGLVFARRFCCACACDAGLNAPAQAQSYPSKNITIVVSIGAGTGMDVLARLYAEKLQAALASRWWSRTSPAPRPCWRQRRSRPSPPDGHTLVVLTSAAMAINQSLYKQINYSPENDFVPISLYVKSPFILVANPEPAVQDRAGVHQARQAGEAAAELRDGGRRRRCSTFRWSSPSSGSVSTRSMCLTARPGNRSPIWPQATSTSASSRPARRSR